jgi:hypothetical protein
LGYSTYGLVNALFDDRVPTLDKLVALAEFAGGLGGMLRARSARMASDYGEFSAWNTQVGRGWQNVRWSAGDYLGQLAHNHGSWWRLPAWVAAQAAGFKTCFAPGTPLRTPDGSRNIEDIRVGDLVLSRDEHNCEGPVEAKVVEEVFVRAGSLWRLDVNGQTIRTTGEHPFFVAGKGWVPCHQLKVGERLLSESGAWLMVEAVEDTGVWSTVYNLRIADYHTYFVGDADEWGFSVWVHNYGSEAEFVHQEGHRFPTAEEARLVYRDFQNDYQLFGWEKEFATRQEAFNHFMEVRAIVAGHIQQGGEPFLVGRVGENFDQARPSATVPEHYRLLVPGDFRADFVPDVRRGRATTQQMNDVQPIGVRCGCHQCGATIGGRVVLDHQPPSELVPMIATRLGVPVDAIIIDGYPQCTSCRPVQGGQASQAIQHGYVPEWWLSNVKLR